MENRKLYKYWPDRASQWNSGRPMALGTWCPQKLLASLFFIANQPTSSTSHFLSVGTMTAPQLLRLCYLPIKPSLILIPSYQRKNWSVQLESGGHPGPVSDWREGSLCIRAAGGWAWVCWWWGWWWFWSGHKDVTVLWWSVAYNPWGSMTRLGTQNSWSSSWMKGLQSVPVRNDLSIELWIKLLFL